MKKHINHTIDAARRRALLGGLSATALSFASIANRVRAQPAARSTDPAQVEVQGTRLIGALHGLPKIALVIGNSAYKGTPLRNPVNDAKALAAVLEVTGFNVTIKLDAGKDDLAHAVQNYAQLLAQNKCVGLFYFAGHGAQLAWRNYMVPVDATVSAVTDIPAQCVELGVLMEGLKKAANPMNVVILDACRDNPFGNLRGIDYKGLSQVDAPIGTLLAYATAPGNVASDGEGANGLYTAHLLREIKVPEATIEDVFKRVRLGVRRSSNGQQIPWESTFLEEDFYFIPPSEMKLLSNRDTQRRLAEELAIWEKVKDASEPGPLEDYLHRYPGGRFSELAQFQLDRVLATRGERKIEIASNVDNPFSKGTAHLNTSYKVGDWYAFRLINRDTGYVLDTYRHTVTQITENEVHFNNGRIILDLFGNSVQNSDGRRFTGQQFFIHEYSVGKRWITQYSLARNDGATGESTVHLKVLTREKITVQAGVFDCFRVKAHGLSKIMVGGVGGEVLEHTFWLTPNVRRPIVQETLRESYGGKVIANTRRELVAYHQG